MEKSNNSELFKLLLKNDEKELKKFILSNGKSPKPVSPIRFIKPENKNEEKEN